MIKQIIYCDHCGEEIDTKYGHTDLTIDIGCDWFDTDLCDECWKELKYKIRQFCKKDGEDK